ncbi:MAG: acyl-CoA dehydratase activase, partial [Thermoanaerobaculales bacterium]|nr:acyl-CoA dehydratase activase [Thermoanaerobaculales bacterium]
AATARACLDEAADAAGVEANQVIRTVSTGYGRRNVDFADDTRTELHCHGVGCYHHFPSAITIVDIGCQDNKIIRLDEDGRRVDFKMNRKCAAGTGAFLEEIALRLDVELEELERLASSTSEAVRLNSFCTVFASTEILSHLRSGAPLAGLIRGAFASVVSRVAEMDRLGGEVVLTGGVVAHNPTTVEIFAERLKGKVRVAPKPQFTGALGAALTALAQAESSKEEEHA